MIALSSHRTIQEPSESNYISKHSHSTVTACCNVLWNLLGSDHSSATRRSLRLTAQQEPKPSLAEANDTLIANVEALRQEDIESDARAAKSRRKMKRRTMVKVYPKGDESSFFRLGASRLSDRTSGSRA